MYPDAGVPRNSSPISITDLLTFIETVGIIKILFILLVLSLLFGFLSARKELLNHWNVLIKGLSYSPQSFYEQLTEELKKEEIEGLRLSTKNIHEGGILSGRRQYATLSWKEFSYSVCASPFANSFFVSYRLLGRANRWAHAFARTPWIGKYIVKWFFPISWYREDTIMMFHSLVHESIVKVVNDISQEKGIARLTDRQCEPKVKDLFKR